MGFDFFNLFINIKVVFFDLLIEKRLKLFKINQKDIENNSNWNWQYDFDFNIQMDVAVKRRIINSRATLLPLVCPSARSAYGYVSMMQHDEKQKRL